MIQPCIIPLHCLFVLYILHCICIWLPAHFHWSQVKQNSPARKKKSHLGRALFECFWEKLDPTLASHGACSWLQKVDNQTVTCSFLRGLLTGLKVDVWIRTSVSAPRRDNLLTIHGTLIYEERVYFEQFALTKKMCNLCGSLLWNPNTKQVDNGGILFWKQSVLRIPQCVLSESDCIVYDGKIACLFFTGHVNY